MALGILGVSPPHARSQLLASLAWLFEVTPAPTCRQLTRQFVYRSVRSAPTLCYPLPPCTGLGPRRQTDRCYAGHDLSGPFTAGPDHATPEHPVWLSSAAYRPPGILLPSPYLANCETGCRGRGSRQPSPWFLAATGRPSRRSARHRGTLLADPAPPGRLVAMLVGTDGRCGRAAVLAVTFLLPSFGVLACPARAGVRHRRVYRRLP